ncbi:hypothetical protein [Entomospira culicis]|uniref:Uncharacterized protein n=1 Tax=Entomospira culicis TaxID=2719989 RepID=A0A968GFJ7_9SPIO|nr:hypothetical protein [Entomospira culicis]NIZ19158.1 hypothetical protein [Entomospira culicis]NIZ69372.1 hypothetical protein [Entomospira culicis]WDI36489.1 hypothetical protein PVA46_03980 [Entomospira culicis]WDI38115.1 hypothetical protein PVA47_03980 [Entomospira culicis]
MSSDTLGATFSYGRSIFDLSSYSTKVQLLLSTENMPYDEQYKEFLLRGLALNQRVLEAKARYPLGAGEISEFYQKFLLKISNQPLHYDKASRFFSTLETMIDNLATSGPMHDDSDEMDELIESLSFNLSRVKRREEQTNRLKDLLRNAEMMKRDIMAGTFDEEEV